MNREEIRNEAAKRMELMELHCQDSYVNPAIQAYYRLNHLVILGSFRHYYSHYGWLKVHPGEAQDGALEVFKKPLSDFEKDCIQLLNQEIELNERTDSRRRDVRVIGLVQ